jgi:hypothetical protein
VATDEQVKVAMALKLDVRHDTSSVVAAKILDKVAIAILDRPRVPSTVRQRKFGSTLGLDLALDSVRVASARIQGALRARAEEAVRRLRLKPEMVVIVETEVGFEGQKETLREPGVVSSIKNGIVYFRGGNGRCASATRIRRPTRREVQDLRAGKK